MEEEKEEKKQKGKGGRPIKEESQKRSYRIGLRFSMAEKVSLKQKAERAGLTPSEYIRQASLKGRIIPAPGAEELKAYRELTGIANNLNQLTKEAHKQNLPMIAPRLLKAMEDVNKLIKSLDNKDENR